MSRMALFLNNIGHRRPTPKDFSRMAAAACDMAGFADKQICANPFWKSLIDDVGSKLHYIGRLPVSLDPQMPTDRIIIRNDEGETLAILRGLCDCTEIRHV